MKITSWTRAERARCCADKEDCIDDQTYENLKNGMVLRFK